MVRPAPSFTAGAVIPRRPWRRESVGNAATTRLIPSRRKTKGSTCNVGKAVLDSCLDRRRPGSGRLPGGGVRRIRLKNFLSSSTPLTYVVEERSATRRHDPDHLCRMRLQRCLAIDPSDGPCPLGRVAGTGSGPPVSRALNKSCPAWTRVVAYFRRRVLRYRVCSCLTSRWSRSVGPDHCYLQCLRWGSHAIVSRMRDLQTHRACSAAPVPAAPTARRSSVPCRRSASSPRVT